MQRERYGCRSRLTTAKSRNAAPCRNKAALKRLGIGSRATLRSGRYAGVLRGFNLLPSLQNADQASNGDALARTGPPVGHLRLIEVTFYLRGDYRGHDIDRSGWEEQQAESTGDYRQPGGFWVLFIIPTKLYNPDKTNGCDV